MAIAVVVTGSLLPGGSEPIQMLALLGVNDKVEHTLAYFSLAFLPALYEGRPRLAYIAPALVALGVLLEFGQLFSPGRDFEIGDMLADAVGVAAGVPMGLWARPLVSARLVRAEGPPG